MRILVITPYFYPHPGGSQRYIEELYARLVAADHSTKVDVLCYNTDGARATQKYRGLQIYRIPAKQLLPGQFALPNYLSLVKVVRQLKAKHGTYDVVNAHTRFFDNAWWTPWVAKYLGAKSILTDHCAASPIHDSRVVRVVAKTVDQLLAPKVVAAYDQVTVVSQATAAFLNQLTGITSTIVYPGIDTRSHALRQTKAIRHIPGLDRTFTDQDVLVTFVGRLIPAKGIEVVLQAADHLRKSLPQVHFIVAGGGPLLPIAQTKANDNLHVLGPLKPEAVTELLNVTDICVHPSKHHEGFPLVITEAGASGCAVIATDQGGTRELIQHHQTGLLVEATVNSLTRAIHNLATDPQTRQRLAQSLRQQVQSQLRWPSILKTYRQTLADTVQA